jgi:hypothetical protein
MLYNQRILVLRIRTILYASANLSGLSYLLALIVFFSFQPLGQAQEVGEKPNSIIAHELATDATSENIRNTLTPLLITRFGGGAAPLVQRISGVSVTGGYVSVRGLSPRYTTFFYDNLSAGVTEQNIKTFPSSLYPGVCSMTLRYTNRGLHVTPVSMQVQ